MPLPKRRLKPPSYPPPPAPRPSLISGVPSGGVPASLLTPALSCLPPRPVSPALPSHIDLLPPSSRSSSPAAGQFGASDNSGGITHGRSPSIDYSARKVSSGTLITTKDTSLVLETSLPVTTELSPSYLVIENRKDSFASEYEVNRQKAPLGKIIDPSKIKNVSEEDLRTILTFFPTSGSTSESTSQQPVIPETEKSAPKCRKVWPPGSSADEDIVRTKLVIKPREKLPPRPMVPIHPVRPVVLEGKKGMLGN